MRWIAFVAVLLMLSFAVFADDHVSGPKPTVCSDTDGGPDKIRNPDDHSLSTRGTVKYGVSEYDDVCLDFKGGLTAKEGLWLKEFYCENDQRKSVEYECSDYGFAKCEDGECVKGGTGSSTNTSTAVPAIPASSCGNEKLEKDKGEECDPPHKVCFGADISEYGLCSEDCKCIIATPEHTKCGNNQIDEGETCESDADCEHWEYCKSCLCVEKPVSSNVTKVEEGKDAGAVAAKVDVGKTAAEIDKKYPAKDIAPVDVGNVTDFTKDPAIQATGKIANFFKGIFGWIVGLFS